jgi:plastocyanin
MAQFISGIVTLSAATSTSASTSRSTAAASTQVVLVGYNSHEFHPSNLTANPGDLIVFQFIAQGHTVVQSNFEQPCIPRDTYQRDLPTFYSGWFNGSDVLGDNVSLYPHPCRIMLVQDQITNTILATNMEPNGQRHVPNLLLLLPPGLMP